MGEHAVPILPINIKNILILDNICMCGYNKNKANPDSNIDTEIENAENIIRLMILSIRIECL